jgi:hypothetical protein
VLAIDRTTPYAILTIECKKISAPSALLLVGHKLDFLHLWHALKERQLKPTEELLLVWTTKHYRNRIFKLLSPFMPKLYLMVCPKNAFEEINSPRLTGEASAKATLPVAEYKPEVFR